MKFISRNELALSLKCTKPEDYQMMLEVIDIDWLLNLSVENQRKFLTKIKKGEFVITVSLAKKRGLYFEESSKEVILSDSDVDLLIYLKSNGGYTIMELSDLYTLSSSTLSGKMFRFMSYGLINKHKTIVNKKRRTELVITKKGVRYLNDL